MTAENVGPCTEDLSDPTIPDGTDVLPEKDADFSVEETNAKEMKA